MLLRHPFNIINAIPTITCQHLKCILYYMLFPGWKILGTVTKVVQVYEKKQGLRIQVYVRISFQEKAGRIDFRN